MSSSKRARFDAGDYWQKRVGSGADLSVVGHRSVGRIYNRHIYERRVEVLDAMMARHATKSFENLRVLDIGCGSGFYTEYWATQGVREYVGVDISGVAVESLAEKFPQYRFIVRDVGAPGSHEEHELGTFDVVTLFDVLYHIVDEQRFENAVRLISCAASPSARVLVMDQLFARRYQLLRHVVYRDRAGYLDAFANRGLHLADDELLFHYLVPPLSGRRVLDGLTAATFKGLGALLRLSSGLESRVAGALRRLDADLRHRGKQVVNSEFLVFYKDPT